MFCLTEVLEECGGLCLIQLWNTVLKVTGKHLFSNVSWGCTCAHVIGSFFKKLCLILFLIVNIFYGSCNLGLLFSRKEIPAEHKNRYVLLIIVNKCYNSNLCICTRNITSLCKLLRNYSSSIDLLHYTCRCKAKTQSDTSASILLFIKMFYWNWPI